MTVDILAPVSAGPKPPPSITLAAVLDRVARRAAPLFPLEDFVAVNPFLGHAGSGFAAALGSLEAAHGAPMLMPRRWYAAKLAEGAISDADLADGIAASGFAGSVADLRVAAAVSGTSGRGPAAATFADILSAGDVDWASVVVEEIGKWCAALFDDGQAVWPAPWQGLPPYTAWRAAVRHDLQPEILGVAGFRRHVAGLPEDPAGAIAEGLALLGVTGAAVEVYLDRALATLAGWCGHARARGWDGERAGAGADGVIGLLAIRVAWDAALHRALCEGIARAAWGQAVAAMAVLGTEGALPDPATLALHEAFEAAARRRLVSGLARPAPASGAGRLAQAVFCIDVRSEILRRALETVVPEIETDGFAGFFGFALEHRPAGARRGTAQCPVLLAPRALVCDAGGPDGTAAAVQARLRRRVESAWSGFKAAAVSGFAAVEAVGTAAIADLAARTLGRSGADPARAAPGLADDTLASTWVTRGDDLVDAAEGVLRAMSLTTPFAPLVLLVGHGATSANNPHAAGLACGACGGHAGDVNARYAAAVFNDPRVRAGLAARGWDIPAGTLFVAGLHETTTDRVSLFVPPQATPDHRATIRTLAAALERAGALARAERAPRLGLPSADPLRAMAERAADWSQLRPEWALAGNRTFIVAPRARTRGLDLEGSAFLHSYAWQQDPNGDVLAMILSAPMVVASWINLQYFGSVTAPDIFGAGNKALHNVVGRIGVVEGAGGDLRSGLPWQSVHDGRRFVHEPVRLSVAVEAPEALIESVLSREAGVRALVDNGWVHLMRIDGSAAVWRRVPGEGWVACAGAGSA